MEDDIGIRMAPQSEGVRNLNTTENELSPALETMDIESVPYSIVSSHK